MRNHSFLYLLRPDGEEGELQRIAESNSVFPSLWKIFFADGCVATDEVRRVLNGTAAHVVQADAADAVARFRWFKERLTGEGPEPVEGFFRYLDGAERHLRGLIEDWSLSGAAAPVLCADFDEMAREGAPDEFLRDQLASCAHLWRQIVQLAHCDTRAVETLLSFRTSNLRFTDWRAWSGLFGLALFQHEYFAKAFRKPFPHEYADHEYDPLGSDDDLGEGVHRFRNGDRWDVRTAHGHVVLAAECVWPFQHGCALVEVNEHLGYIDSQGAFITEDRFDVAEHFTEHGVARVGRRGRYGLLRTTGTLALDIVYSSVEWSNDFEGWLCSRDGMCTLVRADGGVWLDAWQQIDVCVPRQLIRVRRNRRFRLLDWSGGPVIDDEFDRIEPLRGDVSESVRLVARRANRVGVIDARGATIVPFDFSRIEPLHVVVDLDHEPALRDCIFVYSLPDRSRPKAGVWDIGRGGLRIPCEYDRIEPLSAILRAHVVDSHRRVL
jgi:hypothetical protein